MRVESPATVPELQAALASSDGWVNLSGNGNGGGNGGGGSSAGGHRSADQLTLRFDRLTGVLRADRESGLVTVLAGTGLRELNQTLWHLGLALPNLPDDDRPTIAAAVSVGAHGTGAKFGGLATCVRGLQLVTADGERHEISAGHPDFNGVRIGLGALGVIATLTLQCVPAFALAESTAPGTLDSALAELDQNVDGNDHFELRWFPHTRRVLTWRANRVRPGTELSRPGPIRRYVDERLRSDRGRPAAVLDAVHRLTTRRPSLIPRVNALSARALPRRDRIERSYAVLTAPHPRRYHEMEYAVPGEAVRPVLSEIRAYLARTDDPVSAPLGVRFAAADDLWLSTAYARPTGYITVREYHRRDHRAYFQAVEAIARDVDGRPHWGLRHECDAESLAATYPHHADFVRLRERLDPQRRFTNAYLDRILGR